MTITKHGKFYSDIKDHIQLYGKCSRCECEFKTFVDLYWDAPEKEAVTIITDQSCKDMKVQPEFDYCGPDFIDGKYVIRNEIIGLRTISASMNCPDCGELTELKMVRGAIAK